MADPFSSLIAFVLRSSLTGKESDDPRSIRNDPEYDLADDATLGRIPVTRRSPGTKALLWVIRMAVRLARALSPVDTTRWRSIDEAKAQALALYGDQLPREALAPTEEHLSDCQLFKILSFRAFTALRPEGDAFAVDLRYPEGIRYKPGFVKLDCRILLDPQRVLSIETGGAVYRPGQPGWDLAKMIVRSSLFTYASVVWHSAWLHGVISPQLFLGVYRELSPDHPLRRLLLPYVHEHHHNVARSRFSVFSPVGGALATLPLLGQDAAGWIKREIRAFEPILPEDLPVKWSAGYAAAERIWSVMRAHVGRYVQRYGLADDATTSAFVAFLAHAIHPRLGSLPLDDTITYVMFAPSVFHHLWGHIYNGTVDPVYVSTAIQQPDSDGGPLMSRGETRAHSAIRIGVMTSIARPVPRLTGDFSHLAVDEDGAGIMGSLSRSMQETATWLDGYFAERGLENQASPARIATSMSI